MIVVRSFNFTIGTSSTWPVRTAGSFREPIETLSNSPYSTISAPVTVAASKGCIDAKSASADTTNFVSIEIIS
jgi:hypothetical protein